MATHNGWSDPSGQGAEEAAEMAAFLEKRASFPDQVQVDRIFEDVLAPSPGEKILEVGCGSGVLCRRMAARLSPGGEITGLDLSQEMIASARRLAHTAGLETVIRFEVGSAYRLPYPDNHFEAVFAARLLLHLDQPEQAVAEMIRVTRPGGRVVLMDWDFDTVAVDHPDRELTRRLLHWRADHHGGNNWSGRQLLHLAVNAGLEDIGLTPAVIIARGEEDGFTHSLWRAAQRACEGGAITPSEHDAWVGLLKDRIRQGQFFASITNFILKGKKPNRGLF